MALDVNLKDYIVAIDESQKGNTFCVVAALIPTANLNALAENYNALRRRVKTHLLENYPGSAEHEDLQGERLPEIHAFDLINSESYYRKRDSEDGDRYYLKHYEWLEEALNIAKDHGVLLLESTSEFPYPKDKDTCQKISGKFQEYEMEYQKRGRRSAIQHKEIKKLCQDAFLINLSNLLFHIESLMSENGLTMKVLIDDPKGSKLKQPLKVVDSFKWLFGIGDILQVVTPEFEESKKEVVLQVADNFCYMIGNAFYAELNGVRHNDDSPKQRLVSLTENIVAPLRRDNNKERFQHGNHAILHILSVLNERCTKNPHAKEFIDNKLKEDYVKAKASKSRRHNSKKQRD